MTELPERIRKLDRELSELHRAHPTAEMADAAQNMTQQLHVAIYGGTWARPESPRDVWMGLLAEVLRMAERARTVPS